MNDWKMEDIYSAARDGNVRFVRQWLDNVENDLNQGYVCGMSWPTYYKYNQNIIVAERKINEGRSDPKTVMHTSCSFSSCGEL